MSGEIKVMARLECTNGNVRIPQYGATQQSIDQTTPGGGVPGQITAVTTGQGTVVSTVGLTNIGWTYIKNLDLTNNIEYGPLVAATLHPFGYLKPGESAVLRLKAGISWNVRALVADCKVEIIQLDA